MEEMAMGVSVGVCAYNEDRNIGALIRSIILQRMSEFSIREIIVVSSGSTDWTEEIVRELAEKDRRIRLVREEARKGKYSAVNQILKFASSNVIVLVSADVIVERDAIRSLCRPLKDKMVGITTCRPVPVSPKTGFWGYVAYLIWDMHHELSLKSPKFTEMIAFRKIMDRVPETAVDEEEIASITMSNGYSAKYVPDAVVFNRGPENFRDYLVQRRRIYCGHLDLAKRKGYLPLTANNPALLKMFFRRLKKEPLHLFLAAALVESMVRIIARMDYIRGKRFHVWETADSTKESIK